MYSNIRRAVGFAVVGLFSLLGPVVGTSVSILYGIIALSAVLITHGPIFELFARPGDYEVDRLRGLFGFAVSAAVLGILAGAGNLPMVVFPTTILLVALGNLGAELVRVRTQLPSTLGYIGGGLVGGTVGQLVALRFDGGLVLPVFLTVLLAGVLSAALIRSMLFPRDEPPVVFTVGFLLWLLVAVGIDAQVLSVITAVAVAGGVGLLAYTLDAASIEGMIAGILLGLVTIVLGGYRWFALLVTFFAVGGGSTKIRYQRKLEHGVAEANGGARGGENVLANASAAMAGLFLFALTDAGLLAGDPRVYLFLFAGALATALSDTLASEIGGSFGQTRLITTFAPVPPGTDGGITWQGLVAGVTGAGIIGVLSLELFATIGPTAAVALTVAGVAGMVIDSLLGATIEGTLFGNGGVNFIATSVGGVLGAGLALGLGIVGLPFA